LSYIPVQCLTYCFVVFVLFPMMIWTGLHVSMVFLAGFRKRAGAMIAGGPARPTGPPNAAAP